jgi:hypothetical protein
MRRLQLSIEAGVEPAAVADALNRALEEREASRPLTAGRRSVFEHESFSL